MYTDKLAKNSKFKVINILFFRLKQKLIDIYIKLMSTKLKNVSNHNYQLLRKENTFLYDGMF